MKPLGVISYFKTNYKRTISSMIIISLSSFLLYFTFGIGSAIRKGVIDENINSYNNMTMFIPFNDEIKNKAIQKLESMKELDKIIECNIENTTIDMIVGKTGVDIITVKDDDVKTLLKKMNLKLIEGKYPRNDDDIVMSERVLRGLNKKIGDYIGDEVDEKAPIKGKYKIIGAYAGNSNKFIVKNEKKYEDGCFMIFGKNGGQKAINNYLETLNNKERILITIESIEEQLGNIKPILYGFGIIICLIFVIVLSIIIWNIIYINMVGRKREIALIKAVGYRDKYIKTKLFKENVISFFIASILGNIFGLIGLKVFYEIYCYPRGFDMDIFSPVYLVVGGLVPLVVLIISTIPVSRGLRKIDTVGVLEGNV